jgi:hypothetical protein
VPSLVGKRIGEAIAEIEPVHYPTAPGELIRAIAAPGCDIEVITLEFGRTWTKPSGT